MFVYREIAGDRCPGPAFEAVEARNVASRSQARAGRDPAALFGREAELDLLRECWRLAGEGEGQVALVQGEAGIGKSTLIDTIRRGVVDAGSAHVSWYCGPNFSARSLHPVTEHIEGAAGFARGDSAEVRLGKLAALLDRAGADTPETRSVLADLLSIPVEAPDASAMLTPERRRALSLETLLALMDRLAADGPALFVVEDLHWADPTTLELLDRAVERAIGRQWLILATARPDFACNWSDHADVAHIRLDRLEQDDAKRICARIDAAGLLPPDVARQIVARADGNPLFVEEITRSVMEEIAATPHSTTPAEWSIPDTLQDSLIARLDRLGPARQIASMGAALGRGFGYELLFEVVAQPAAELRQALRELTRAGILDCTGLPPASRYLFSHALMRDAAYDSMPRRQREALHGRIAESLRTLFPGIAQTDPAQLADHLTRSGAGLEAMPLWAEAGRQAASRAAHAEAAGHLRTALDLLRRHRTEGSAIDIELQLLVGLAVSLSATRGFSDTEVGKVLGEARAICDLLGNVAELYPVLRGLCSFMLISGDLEAAEDFARKCETIAIETGLPEHRIHADEPLGWVLWAQGRLVEARVHLERCVETCIAHEGENLSKLQAQHPMSQSLAPLQVLLHAIGDDAGSARASALLMERTAKLADPFHLAFGLFFRAFAALSTGDHAMARDNAAESIALCEHNGLASYLLYARLIHAHALGRLGEPERAAALARATLATCERIGQIHTKSFHLGEIAESLRLAGDQPGALESVEGAIAAAERLREGYWLPQLHMTRARIIGGATPSGRAALKVARSIAHDQGALRFEREAEALLAEAA
nr:AAA family ATPase [Sphingomonadaceae bacterium]